MKGRQGLRKLLSTERTCHKAAEATDDTTDGSKSPHSKRKDGGQDKTDGRPACLKVDQD